MKAQLSRRDFFKVAGAVSAGWILSACNVGTRKMVPTTYPLPSTAAPSFTSIPTVTRTPEHIPALTPNPTPCFLIDGKPFRFLGAFIPGWYWGQWSRENDIALVTQAKQAGISVFHLMAPIFEFPLGNFIESELIKLDHLMDVASKNGLYVMYSFLDGLGIANWEGFAYYNPGGIEGLIHRPALREGFRKHVEQLVTRKNTLNGRRYFEDPTILAWMVIQEIVSAPWNYPNGFPHVTVSQVADWLEENTNHLKRIDPNHLVMINTTGAIETFSDMFGEDIGPILQVPSLDFIELEDAEARILLHPDSFDHLFSFGQPMVMMVSYTGGEVDRDKYCRDYAWQAETLIQVVDQYLKKGAVGFTVFAWRARRVQAPDFDSCFSYDIENQVIVDALKTIVGKLGEQNHPPIPLQFVRLQK